MTEYQAPRRHGDETLYQFTDSTVADIEHIILHSTSKTCALDPVPTSILKDNAETFAPMIMKIVNASLQSGTVPADMKHALVTPLHKRHGLDTNNLRNSKRMAINGMTKRLCEEEDVGYVDLWDSCVGIEELYARDGLHLSGKGAAAFAEGLSGAVASGLGKVRYLN